MSFSGVPGSSSLGMGGGNPLTDYMGTQPGAAVSQQQPPMVMPGQSLTPPSFGPLTLDQQAGIRQQSMPGAYQSPAAYTPGTVMPPTADQTQQQPGSQYLGYELPGVNDFASSKVFQDFQAYEQQQRMLNRDRWAAAYQTALGPDWKPEFGAPGTAGEYGLVNVPTDFWQSPQSVLAQKAWKESSLPYGQEGRGFYNWWKNQAKGAYPGAGSLIGRDKDPMLQRYREYELSRLGRPSHGLAGPVTVGTITPPTVNQVQQSIQQPAPQPQPVTQPVPLSIPPPRQNALQAQLTRQQQATRPTTPPPRVRMTPTPAPRPTPQPRKISTQPPLRRAPTRVR